MQGYYPGPVTVPIFMAFLDVVMNMTVAMVYRHASQQYPHPGRPICHPLIVTVLIPENGTEIANTKTQSATPSGIMSPI